MSVTITAIFKGWICYFLFTPSMLKIQIRYLESSVTLLHHGDNVTDNRVVRALQLVLVDGREVAVLRKRFIESGYS